MNVEAWILEPGEKDNNSPLTHLKQGFIELKELSPEEVLVEPIYGCWEGNMGHAVDRNPIDVCLARREAQVIIGNAGVVRVLKSAKPLAGIHPGQCYILFSGETRNLPRFNYPLKAYGYDSPGTLGLLAKQTIVHYKQLLPIPENTRFSLQQWAAFSLRYITAWGNWKVASKTYRAMVSEEEEAHPPVWGWGGGVSLAIAQLAKQAGYQTALIASQSKRLSLIEQLGITAVDRRLFQELDFRNANKAQYLQAEKIFIDLVHEKTNDQGVAIFVDLIGEPVLKATIKAMARPGVITTAGWKEGMHISYLRALACLQWQAYIHTHYASLTDAHEAIAYAEQNNWMPPLNNQQIIYPWDDMNHLLDDYRLGNTDYFPLYAVNNI